MFILHSRIKNIGTIFALMIGIAFTHIANAQSTVNVGHTESSGAGQFLDTSGSSLNTGGVSVGFFQGTAPTDWSTFAINASPSSVYQTLTNPNGIYKFLDLRNISGVTFSSGFDWSFPLTLSGTVNNIPISTLPSGTQLYVMAFNQGDYTNSFATSTQWAVAAASTWGSPLAGGTKPLSLIAVTKSTDLKIGTDNGSNVNLLTAPAPAPEPSRSLLAMMGAVFLLFRRRR